MPVNFQSPPTSPALARDLFTCLRRPGASRPHPLQSRVPPEAEPAPRSRSQEPGRRPDDAYLRAVPLKVDGRIGDIDGSQVWKGIDGNGGAERIPRDLKREQLWENCV
jgi:hypothetical protein